MTPAKVNVRISRLCAKYKKYKFSLEAYYNYMIIIQMQA